MGIEPFAQSFGDFLKAQAVEACSRPSLDRKLDSAPQGGGGEQWIPSPDLTHVAFPLVGFFKNWFIDLNIRSFIVQNCGLNPGPCTS